MMNVQHNQPVAVHPAAEAYRMMTDEELASLAASIAENGQRDPCILGRVKGSTEQPKLVDGRNREKACGIAGVVPKFEVIEFEDEDAIRRFIKDRSERRDISKGQRAMGHALLFPEPEKGGRGRKKNSSETEGFSAARLSQARSVLAFSRDLAAAVRDGTEKLDEAYARVQEARRALDTKEAKLAQLQTEASDLAELVAEDRVHLDEAIATLETRKQDQAKLAEVKEEAPDLMALVDDGRMSAQDALVAYSKRTEEERNRRRGTTKLFAAVMRLLAVQYGDPEQEAARLMKDFDPLMWPADELGVPNHQLFDALATMLTTCAKIRKEQEKRQ